VTTEDDCEAAADILELSDTSANVSSWSYKPKGCSYGTHNSEESLRFNTDSDNDEGATSDDSQICVTNGTPPP
jgi:hypothetical protein